MNAEGINQPIQEIAVFLYHAVAHHRPARLARRERKYWMEAGDFRRHVKFFERYRHLVARLEHCWRAKAFTPLTASILQPSPAPMPVVLTFDDGWESDFRVVWPLLAEAGLPATCFVNTATLGKFGHLRWSHVREMSAAGVSFQSHSHRHIDLTRLGKQDLKIELRMSKDLLEGWVKQPVEFLSVPYGRVSRRVVDAALAAGYRAVCTSDPKPALPRAEQIGRIAIHANTRTGELARLMDGSRIAFWKRSARAALLWPARPFLRAPAPQRKFSPEAAR